MDIRSYDYDPILREGDMAELVDAMDLIELSLGMETYQVIASKSKETPGYFEWVILSQIWFMETIVSSFILLI
jgi:hypothetical protein